MVLHNDRDVPRVCVGSTIELCAREALTVVSDCDFTLARSCNKECLQPHLLYAVKCGSMNYALVNNDENLSCKSPTLLYMVR